MSYVDGFVIPLAADRIDAYREMAAKAAAIWKKHGALDYKECIADDDGHEGLRAFADLSGAMQGEVTVIAFITYQSREHRDAVNARVMADPDLQCDPDNMPFDPRRMAFAGFRTFVGDEPAG